MDSSLARTERHPDLHKKFDVKSLNEEEEQILTFMMAIDISRFILLTANLVLGMGGILFLAFGLIYAFGPHPLMNGIMKRQTNEETVVIYKHIFRRVGICFFCLGVVAIFVSFFGFYATSTGRSSAIIQLAVFVLLTTVCQMILAFHFLQPNLHHSLKDSMKDYMFKDLKEDITFSSDKIITPTNLVWTAIQLNFNCCGIEGPSDYSELDERNMTAKFYEEVKVFAVPISCCTTLKPVENAAAILDVDFENLEKCIEGNEDFHKLSVYFIAFAIFDWWTASARRFVT